MPKLKTKRGALKRFKKTKGGKIKFKKAGLRHLLVNKPKGRKRGLKKARYISKSFEKKMSRLVPYI